MKVCELGEFELIAMLNRIIDEAGVGHRSRKDIVIAIGDDAAAWQPEAALQLGTTDVLVQGIHFTLETTSWNDLGWKSLAVNISDIAAMGGIPTCAMISLGLPTHTEADHIADLYRGMTEIARQFDMAIVGGDITEAPVLVISPTVIGRMDSGKPLTRSEALPGDKIAVTGYLGGSAAGLRMLRENRECDPEVASILAQAHRRPVPRVDAAQILIQNGVRNAIDISDGLIADLSHICEASNVAAIIHSEKVPVHPAVRAAFADDALELALAGGEDYELLFTAPYEAIQKVAACCADLPRMRVTIIGDVVEDESARVFLRDRNGKDVGFAGEGGWKHFARKC